MFMQQCICPVADFGNVWTVVCLPSSKFQSTSYSLSIMSSIVGPGAFGFSKVVPTSIGRSELHGGKMATLQWPLSKVLPLLALSPPRPIVTCLIKEVTTSIKWSSCSNLKVRRAYSTALSPGLPEKFFCLLPIGWGVQHLAKYGLWGQFLAISMFLHLEILYDVFSGDIHKLPNGLL